MKMDREEIIIERMIDIIEIEKKGLRILLKIRNKSSNFIDHKKVRNWIYEKLEMIRSEEKRFREYIEKNKIF